MEDFAVHHLEKNLGCPEQLRDQETTKDCTETIATGRSELSQWRTRRSCGRLPAAGVEPMETTSPLDKLREGFQHFNEEIYQKKRTLYQELSQGQKPKYMIIACSDSRVCPSNVMQLQPGEAFMVRNIANMVPPYDKVRYSEVGAAIEYAVTHLKVQNIVVLGHSSCGGIKGLMALRDDATTSSSFVDNWVKIGLPAKKKVKEAYPNISEELQHARCEVESVNVSLGNLLTYPYVKERVSNKSLLLYGGYYNFFEGSLEFWGTPAKII